jgi:hypothetical protein
MITRNSARDNRTLLQEKGNRRDGAGKGVAELESEVRLSIAVETGFNDCGSGG